MSRPRWGWCEWSPYDPQLQTRLYFPLSEPDSRGLVSVVDPNADAIVIYFHGSGTRKASGKNFLPKMQALIHAGLSPLADGSSFPLGRSERQPVPHKLNYFMRWLHVLIQRCKAYQKPIYMVGHSFGPFVIKRVYRALPHRHSEERY